MDGLPVVLCVLLSLVANSVVSGSRKYVIHTPNYIHDQQSYQLSISTFDLDGPAELNLFIEEDDETKIQQKVMLHKNETRMIEIDTSTLPLGYYNLRLQSQSAIELNRNISLTYLPETYAVILQTDKPIYKPGNTIKFRILVLDQNIKQLQNLKSIHVKLANPDGHIIKVWPSAKLRKGIFQSQLEIANEPSLGNWNITAVIRGEEYIRSFVVEEYKLARHEIKISSPQVATYNDEEFIVDVEAVYSFGRPIKGEVTVVVDGIHKKISKIIGRARVSFNMRELVTSDSHKGTVLVNVRLQELHTKQLFYAKNNFRIFDNLYKISLKQASKYFVPGHNHRCWLRFTDPLDGKLRTLPSQTTITISYSGRERLPDSTHLYLTPDSDGIIPLILSIPPNATVATLTVLGDQIDEEFLLSADNSNAGQHFQVAVVTQKILINHPIAVQVLSSESLDFIVHQVVSKKRILLAKRLEVNREKSFTFNMTITAEMIPSAKMFVYSIQTDRMISDSITLDVDQLPNVISLSLSDQKATPGQKIQLQVKSQPYSMVGLLAIDKSALLLQTGNQITKNLIFNELLNYELPNGDDEESAKVEDVTLLTNIIQPIGISARYGNYDGVEEDAYIKPRANFPQTWLWHRLEEVGSDGQISFHDQVPDSTTNWQISAFALSPEHGLGVLEEPVNLQVTKPFFIMLNVPYSIKKKEIAIVEANLFNYLDEMMYVGVTLKNHRQEFEFVNNDGRSDASYQVKNVVLTQNSAKSVKFMIKSKKMGDIMIKVIAESSEASDSVERFLRVMPESLPYHKTERRYIQLENASFQKFPLIKLQIPRYIDAGSENISFSVFGDLLGNAVDNLPELIRLPSGSGEQNVLKMVPNIVLLSYMLETGSFDDRTELRALRFLNIGYQNQLKFRLADGSFNMFGTKDEFGSVFLTALVAKTLYQASKFISVDGSVVDAAYNWIEKQQNGDGSFHETGDLTNRYLQKVHSDAILLTAYTLIAFLENEPIASQYPTVIEKGTSYLSSRFAGTTSRYRMALIAYALILANHTESKTALDELISLSTASDGSRYWEDEFMSTEATAYALLSYIHHGHYVDSGPIVGWLIKKRYYYSGSLENTQTTFVSLQAVAEYAKKASHTRNNYDVTIVDPASKQSNTIHIDSRNSLTPQNISLSPSVRAVEVMLNGTGSGIFVLNYDFYTNILELKPRFDVTHRTINTTTADYLDLEICAKYNPRERYEEVSFVVMEIIFPSGYIALDESVEELEALDVVKKVATKHDETTLQLYFDSFPEYFQCLNVTGFRQSGVLQQIPGTIRIFSSFDNTLVKVVYFDGKQIQICDDCEDDCPAECNN